MNERIQELAKQAGDIATELYQPPKRSKEPGKIWEDGHVQWTEIFNQKFAELIVRECAGINYNSSFQDGEFHAREVLEHFGVES